MEDCENCGGTGWVKLLCAHCNGSGEGMHDGTKCWECKGSGVIPWECSECSGTGQICQLDDEDE